MSWLQWILANVLKPIGAAIASWWAIFEIGPVAAVLVCWAIESLSARELLPARLVDGQLNPDRKPAGLALWRRRRRRIRLVMMVVVASVLISHTFEMASGLDYAVCFLASMYLLIETLSNAQKADGMFRGIREWVEARLKDTLSLPKQTPASGAEEHAAHSPKEDV